jgi:hypothetical protein
MKKIALASLLAATVLSTQAHAENLVFTLTNGTDSVLTRFYTSPTGTASWEEDVFGQDVLGPGESVEVTIADGRSVCDYDLRFEFEAGSSLATTEDSQNLCETGSYTISE